MPTSALDKEQIRQFQLQVYRDNTWIDIPVNVAQGQQQKNTAGQLTVALTDRQDDQFRSRLYEGEKVRAYRGVVGSPLVRCWTGYVDSPTATNNANGKQRQAIITDYIKELNDAILITGVCYDNVDPMKACADAIQQAINTGQFTPTDDNGNFMSSTASYGSPTGNGICYFPELYNADGTLFLLASGTVGSWTQGNNNVASFTVPVASGGASYTAFILPNRYLIASTTQSTSFTIASSSPSSTPLPPASGSVYIDFFNGICYFNALDGGKIMTLTGSYSSSPNFAYAPGSQIGDVILEILDNTGFRVYVDGFGKISADYIVTTKVPKRILSQGQYMNLQIQTNRDRRNVIVCEGWDGNCGEIITSKAVNYNDINNPPPKGLGKRAYMILQNPAWGDQSACNNAAYFAMQQVGRRGKVFAMTIVDDPSLGLEDVIAFSGGLPEVSTGEYYWIETINWQYSLGQNGNFNAESQVTGTSLPGQGVAFLGPATAISSLGAYDFSIDAHPFLPSSPTLIPPGGDTSSTFSKSTGLILQYMAIELGTEAIDIYGSDNSHLGPYVTTRASNSVPYNVALPVASMTAGVTYAIQLRFQDQNGTIGYYRDFITALP